MSDTDTQIDEVESVGKPMPMPKPVAFGSKEHEAILAGAYGMSREEAEAIIKERDADPLTHPYEEYKKAKAMLAALKSKPRAISKKPGWKRDRSQVNLGY